ncbi:Cadherin-18 like [Actinidia chinensis var. chinensis]|uniref:Cadherin-18 like n=1 Tax=Actinidia chinensis var. chinensis TaxID=1590841 RepID=A0A2R6R8U3_ACTCC|nr:Cadherin-18 like [Actinidia chinensis var. chinensis]
MGRPNLLIQFTILASIIWSSSSSSIYDVLRSHGLPPGLLPKGITNFTIDPATGRFESHLDSSCNAKFETDFHYEATVTGTLAFGQIGDVSGVSAQDLFLWFPVKGVRVDVPSSGVVYFDVGDGVRKQFSFSSFETPKDCAASPAPANLVLFNRDGPIVELQNQLGKLENDLDRGDALRTAY